MLPGTACTSTKMTQLRPLFILSCRLRDKALTVSADLFWENPENLMDMQIDANEPV